MPLPHFTMAPLPAWMICMFLPGIPLLTLGVTLFTMGVESAIAPIGETIGAGARLTSIFAVIRHVPG